MARRRLPHQVLSGELGNSKTLLGTFVEDSSVATFMVKTDGHLVYANRAVTDLLGYSPGELAGIDFGTLVHPEDLPKARTQVERLISKGFDSFEAERRYLRKGGQPVWVMASISTMPSLDGDSAYVTVQAISIDGQKRAEAALLESERRWNFALESAGQGIWVADIVEGTVYYSHTWRHMRGFTPDEYVDSSQDAWLARIHPEDRERIRDLVRRQNSGELKRNTFEYRERHKGGHYIWVASKGAPDAWAADGSPTRVIGTDTDITQSKLAEGAMRALSRRLKLALQVSGIGVFESDLQSGDLFWDERVRTMYGKGSDSAIEVDEWEQSLFPEDAIAAQKAVSDAVASKGTFNSQFRIIRTDGEVRSIRTTGTYYLDDEGRPKVLGANLDVTEEVAAKRDLEEARDLAEARNEELETAKIRIEHDALHDALTNLPNRRFLDQILAERAAWSARTGGTVGLLHIDLDGFKQINDTLGHIAGDAMLIRTARLLQENLGPGDFVARVGGDEFVVVCSFTRERARIEQLAEHIIDQVRQPVPYNESFCRFGASVGIVTRAGDQVSPKRMLIDADIALYRAKHRGKNRYEVFTEALQAEAENAKHLADDILRAIEMDEFIPYYQPLFDAQSFDLVSVEALVRWRHPDRGILLPAAFLSVAEDINAVSAIDRRVLEKGLRDFERWERSGAKVPSFSVNMSFNRLRDQELIPSLRRLNIRPGILSFELLESIFLDEPDEVVTWNLDGIEELGIDISIDDFGTGHASIISLLKLKPRVLKLDRQFVNEITSSPTQRKLVSSLIGIGKSLGITVVAEGVETMAQAHLLRELECDILQGYAFARPMPADALPGFLLGETWRSAA